MKKVNYYISDISDGNLAFHVGDNFSLAKKNREKLAEKIEMDLESFIFLNQIHGDDIVIIDGEEKRDLYDGDALITNKENTVIGVLVADCVPILLYDEKNCLISAVHAGWKGTNKKIVQKVIKKLIKNGADIENISVIIGPSIGKENYDVGEDVVKFFRNEVKEKLSDGKYLLDLKKENLLQIYEEGIQKTKIKIVEVDTFTDKNYFSARKGNPVGRFGAFIWIN